MIAAEDALKSFRVVMSTLPWWVGYEGEAQDVNFVLHFIKERLSPDHPDYRPSKESENAERVTDQ